MSPEQVRSGKETLKQGKNLVHQVVTLILLCFGLRVHAQIPPPSNYEVDCQGTIGAWSRDASMQDYLSTHDCDCSDGPTRPPVCVEINLEPDPDDVEDFAEPPIDNPVHPNSGSTEFNQNKNDLLGKLKGSGNPSTNPNVVQEGKTALPLKTQNTNTQTNEKTALPLKSGTAPPPVSTDGLMKIQTQEDLRILKEKINILEVDVKSLQMKLRNFNRDLLTHREEFELWAAEVDKASVSALENGKSFAVDLFLEYCLLGYLEKSIQKDTWGKFKMLLNSDNPNVSAWLISQIKTRNLELEDFKTLTEMLQLSGDACEVYKNNLEGFTGSLDYLLFVNDCFETFGWSKAALASAGIMEKTPAGDLFSQARITGQAVADYTTVVFGWLKINRLSGENEKIANEIEVVSRKMESSVKMMECLKQCLANYADGCMDRCSGKTRWTTPPPPLN